ncbi:DUF4309 domain-containing protein [Paenibacillus sp. sgz500958]|uniref:YjgB family protein n=1 Tax=Paenibacillus sp. sgz500958 TaxID=3242475 RepID=UPI0036D29435
MTTSYKAMASILLLSALLGLTACNGNNNGNTASEATAPAVTAAPTASATVAPEATASPEATAAPAESAPEVTAEASASPVADSAQSTSEQLKELLQLAKQGKAPGVEYAAHSGMIDEVEKAWGKPDVEEAAGKGIYATYKDKKVVFGFNKGSQIFDVRSSSAELQTLTLKEIEDTLGKPDDIKKNGQDTIYTYQAGKQYQLKFIIPESKGTVDHISVFSEQDSINNMAG